jgi:hypothetical protein
MPGFLFALLCVPLRPLRLRTYFYNEFKLLVNSKHTVHYIKKKTPATAVFSQLSSLNFNKHSLN